MPANNSRTVHITKIPAGKYEVLVLRPDGTRAHKVRRGVTAEEINKAWPDNQVTLPVNEGYEHAKTNISLPWDKHQKGELGMHTGERGIRNHRMAAQRSLDEYRSASRDTTNAQDAHGAASSDASRQAEERRAVASVPKEAKAATEEAALLAKEIERLIAMDQPRRASGQAIPIRQADTDINVIISGELQRALDAAAEAQETHDRCRAEARRAAEAKQQDGAAQRAAAEKAAKAALDAAKNKARDQLANDLAATKAERARESDRRQRNSQMERDARGEQRAAQRPPRGVEDHRPLTQKAQATAMKAGALPNAHGETSVYQVLDRKRRRVKGLYKSTATSPDGCNRMVSFKTGPTGQLSQLQETQQFTYSWRARTIHDRRLPIVGAKHTEESLAARTQAYAVAAFKDYVNNHLPPDADRSALRAETESREIKEAFKKYYLSGDAAQHLTPHEYTCMSWMVSNAVAEEAREAVTSRANRPMKAAAIDRELKRIIEAAEAHRPRPAGQARTAEEAFVLEAASPTPAGVTIAPRLAALVKMELAQPAEMVAKAQARAAAQQQLSMRQPRRPGDGATGKSVGPTAAAVEGGGGVQDATSGAAGLSQSVDNRRASTKPARAQHLSHERVATHSGRAAPLTDVLAQPPRVPANEGPPAAVEAKRMTRHAADAESATHTV